MAFRALCSLAAALSCILPAGCDRNASSQTPRQPRPDIFLVVIDCLRADHVGAYGYPRPTTPHLDRLAAEGLVFEAAYTNATWTKPSIATLFSGRHPSEHGLLKVGVPPVDEIETDAVPDELPLLAESLRTAGYSTLAAVDQVHLKPALGFARGFDDYRWAARGRSAFQVNERLLDALSKTPRDRPVFAWVHYIDAHWPYNRGGGGAPPELSQGVVRPEPPKEQTRSEIHAWTAAHLDERNRRGLETRYDREVREVDSALGELVAGIRAAGRFDNALIAVTADHGEGFFEHARLLHGFEPYDEVARVPLVMRAPAELDFPVGRRESIVSHVDFAPTLLDLLALPPLPGASGTSYRHVLLGVEDRQRTALLASEFTAALRTGPYKVMRWLDGRTAVFDLDADPGELRDLAANGCSGQCAELRDDLERRLARLATPLAGRRSPLAPDEISELKALGYL